MAADGDRRSDSVSDKAAAMPRSLSPDSPLLLNPPTAAPAAVASGGSVELQRLRSHVLALDALSSSGSSSSDEEREDSALLPLAAAAAAAAASPQLASRAAPQHGADGGTSGAPAADSAAERTAGTAGHSDDVSGGARAIPGCAYPASSAAQIRGPPGAAHAAACQLVAAPPLIRHGAGALAGLLQSPDDIPAAEDPTSPAQRYRQAMGIQQCTGGGWADGAGTRFAPSADGVQMQQRWLLASGRQRQLDEGTGQPLVPLPEEVSRDGDLGAQPAEQPRPPTPPAAEARRNSTGAAPSAGAMRSPPAPPSLPQLRSARPGSSSLGVLIRSLSQPGASASGSPSRGSAAAGEASAATLLSEAASPRGNSVLPRLPSIRVRLSERANPPQEDGHLAGGALPAPAAGKPPPGAEGGRSQASASSVADIQRSAAGNYGDVRSGVASQQSAVAKAERRAARLRRRLRRESRRAGDASPERDPFGLDPRAASTAGRRQSAAAQPDMPEVELVECLSSSCPESPLSGSAPPRVQSVPGAQSQWRYASRDAQPAAEVSSPALSHNTSSFQRRVGGSEDGIELPEQTYPQMLERTIERLRRELYESQQHSASLESSLRCKDQECESLTRLVRELTAARAKAASAKHHLQERHHELLEDFGRQVRVADIARQVQKDANLAVADAQRSTREAEDKCALVRRVALQLQERSRALAAENSSLRSQMASLERVAMMRYGGGQSACMAAFTELRCAETY